MMRLFDLEKGDRLDQNTNIVPVLAA
jgi:hypothetical protein